MWCECCEINSLDILCGVKSLDEGPQMRWPGTTLLIVTRLHEHIRYLARLEALFASVDNIACTTQVKLVRQGGKPQARKRVKSEIER